jgi:diguanylate cyclase (GGDEF)-like protein/PAS domain S-box-containing protein
LKNTRKQSASATIKKKVLAVMVIFITITVFCLCLTYLALSVQSTIRAFVHGEGLWSKAQRDAVLALQDYLESYNPADFQNVQNALKIPMGYRQARLELLKPGPFNHNKAFQGLLAGGTHRDDIPGVIRLMRCCADLWLLRDVISTWAQGDQLLLELQAAGDELHAQINSAHFSQLELDLLRKRIQNIHGVLVPLELKFSETLGAASRSIEGILLLLTASIVTALLALGFYVTARIVSRISQSEAKYRLLLDTASDALMLVDQESGSVLESNRQAEALTGLASKTLIGSPYLNLYPFGQRAVARLASFEHEPSADTHRARLQIQHSSGLLIPVEVRASTTEWDGKPVSLAIVRDITERVRAEEDLRVAANALENIAEGVMITDHQRLVQSVNRAFKTITGYSEQDVIGKPFVELQSDRHPSEFYEALWASINDTAQWQGEIWSRRKNGDVYPAWISVAAVKNDRGEVTNYVSVFNDISQYKSYERRLEHLAHHDALTQLPNRIYYEDIVRNALHRAQQRNQWLALLFIDLDGFKGVNDRYGHAAGDELLASIAARIKACVRQNDIVARVGGDEFTIMLDELTNPQDAVLVAQKLLDIVSQPVVCGGHRVSVFASIGVSYYPQDGNNVQSLLNAADAAMYEAKQEGRNSYRLFSPSMKAKASAKLELANALHQAYKDQQFSLVYQPCLDLITGKITSVEALIRWRHPELGDVAPASFIPLAEDIGLIKPITEWVLHTACQQAAAWYQAGLPPVRMAVNISARHFGDLHLVQGISSILAATGWRPEWLNLEITERVMMRTGEDVEKILAELRDMGIGIALDDFGTGYSSLGYLKHFLIDYLKIDRSFVSGIPADAQDVNIAKAIIAMAKSLNIGIIAEGIETEQQQNFLLAHGCQEGQGYLFSKPLPAPDMEALLRRNWESVSQQGHAPRPLIFEPTMQVAAGPI